MYALKKFLGFEIERTPINKNQMNNAIRNGFSIVTDEKSINNLENMAIKNKYYRKYIELYIFYRRVVKTGSYLQIVLMSVNEEVESEIHHVDQFVQIVGGEGEIIIDNKSINVKSGSSIFIDAGSEHRIVNKGNKPLKLYTIYSSPLHEKGEIE